MAILGIMLNLGEKPRVFFMRNVSKMVQLSVYSQKCVISPDNANGYR